MLRRRGNRLLPSHSFTTFRSRDLFRLLCYSGLLFSHSRLLCCNGFLLRRLHFHRSRLHLHSWLLLRHSRLLLRCRHRLHRVESSVLRRLAEYVARTPATLLLHVRNGGALAGSVRLRWLHDLAGSLSRNSISVRSLERRRQLVRSSESWSHQLPHFLLQLLAACIRRATNVYCELNEQHSLLIDENETW